MMAQLQTVRRIFGGAESAQPVSRAAKLAAGALLAAVALAIAMHVASPPSGTFGVDAKATKFAISELAQQLERADQRGDVAAAIRLMDDVTAPMTDLNTRVLGGAQNLRYCQLAMAHVVDGVIAVAAGGRWYKRQHYLSALEAC